MSTSGRSVAWYRACFGSRRPGVRIPPPRPPRPVILFRLTLAALCVAGRAHAAEDIALASPNGQVRFRLIASSPLTYTVTFRAKPVLEASRIGITVDGVALAEGAEIGAIERYDVDETYAWHGAHSTAHNKCNGARIAVRHARS